MPAIIARADWATVGNPSRLFLDYIASPGEGLPTFIGGVSSNGTFWERALAGGESAGRERDGAAWERVVDSVASVSLRLGTQKAVVDKLRKAGTGDTAFVITGQQPGTLGGPLHTVYKAATAVALASFLEGVIGRPVVPLYWCGSDDTDFGEIRQLRMLTDTYDPVSAAIAQSAHRSGMPVGDISLSPLTTLWQIVRGFTDKFDHGAFVAARVGAALEAAEDHGESAAAILVGFFNGALAVVDGRMGCVRKCAQSVLSDYAREEEEVNQLVRREGERLEQGGYHAQITPGGDSGVFLLEGGLRKSVSAENRGLLLAAIENDIEKCSPGVVARNLVQDHVFRPLAVVLGPAELAYRAQIGALYDKFGVPRPVELPRMGATFLPPPLAALAAHRGEVSGLVENPVAYAKTVYQRSVPSDLVAAVAELTTGLSDLLERFAERALGDLPEKSQQKIRARLGELEDRQEKLAQTAAGAGKVIALEQWPFLGHIEQLIKPDGKPQERWLAGLFPFLYSGDGTGDRLVALARTHVDELMDGHAQHIVYSCGP